MRRVVTTSVFLLASIVSATAQVPPLTTTPGPGGVPIAPGPPVRGYTPGGTGIGGGEIAPGPAARSVPMYREAPGGVPVLVVPPREASGRHGGTGDAASGKPCHGAGCPPDGLRFTVAATEAAVMPDRISSQSALKAALRACWTPPAADVEMSVRFTFRRSGELMAAPFVTYTSRSADAETRRELARSITSVFERCAPFRFTPVFAAGVAGRPFSVRFITGPGSR
jgi:hypothetical protein